MKKILIIHSDMEIGGAETSLLGLLNSVDYSKYKVDLMLLNHVGELMSLIPSEVNILPINRKYINLVLPIKLVLKSGRLDIAINRIIGKIICGYHHKFKKFRDKCYIVKQYNHKLNMKFLPKIKGEYDIGISFIDPHYILGKKVNSKVKIGWLHTDFNRIDIDKKEDYNMWNMCDYIACVSDDCKYAFDRKHPDLKEKSIVIENILCKKFIKDNANKKIDDIEITKNPKKINICSIGRFCEAKNFDNIPNISRKILDLGLDINWYLIGYGEYEEKIKNEIIKNNVEKNVFILGKKINPYPYINQCDVYIQPSRYEGKSVTVREAQILNKPVIITDYKTSKSQLKDGYDGMIVPMENDKCAISIKNILIDSNKLKSLSENTLKEDYTNASEITKIYELIK